MSEKIPIATHQGEIQIADVTISCAVLEDGTRLLNQGQFLRSIGRSRTPKARTGATVAEIPTFLAASNLKPFIDNDLLLSTRPIVFQASSGRVAHGYKAEILPKVCEVFLKAKDADKLLHNQEHIAKQCDILIRGLANVGIIALVDEATGYQEVRDRLALQKILEMFIAKELLSWTKQFPDEFYREMFRLKNWQFSPPSVKRPSVVGRYTNDIVYDRLAPGVLEELKRKNPPDEKGRRKHKHHQWLTLDIGHPKLKEHISNVIVLMKAASNWDNFYRMIQRALPRYGSTIPLDLDDES